MKPFCSAFFLIVGLLSQGSFALSEEDFVGRWEIMIDDTGTTFNACWLEVNRSDSGLSGSLLWRWGSVTPAKSIKLVGDELQVVRSEGYKKKTYDVEIYKTKKVTLVKNIIISPNNEHCYASNPNHDGTMNLIT